MESKKFKGTKTRGRENCHYCHCQREQFFRQLGQYLHCYNISHHDCYDGWKYGHNSDKIRIRVC